MGNCIIPQKKKCKKKEVCIKKLSLEESSNKNSILIEEPPDEGNKNQIVNTLNEINLNNENDNHNQSSIKEHTINDFVEETNKENENIDFDTTYNSSVYKSSERSSSISSLPSYHTPICTPKLPKLCSDDRPIQPMPTPFRIDAVTPGRRIENLCDHRGRVRKDAPFQVYLAKKRRETLFVN
uniref:Shugoshin C-terminal domain-containing protein n=1 Tax=Strongyloides stercoralis TaxID=6248 RepID=A0A0K0EMI0_STRER